MLARLWRVGRSKFDVHLVRHSAVRFLFMVQAERKRDALGHSLLVAGLKPAACTAAAAHAPTKTTKAAAETSEPAASARP